MINDKTFEHRPISELISIVKNDFRRLDEEGLIDEGRLIKTVMACNEKLGLTIKEIREVAIPIFENRAKLPVDFHQLFYVCAIGPTNTMVHHMRNPFDNQFDYDVIYDAKVDSASLGGQPEAYHITINRITNTTVHHYGEWVELSVDDSSKNFCHIDCPNRRPNRQGKNTVTIKEDHIECPFRSGTLYLMYIGQMVDANGEVTFPFHPLLTPYYEWSLKEKILSDAIFNSDQPNLGELFKLAQSERLKAWSDAYDLATSKEYGYYTDRERKKQLNWYYQYFRVFR